MARLVRPLVALALALSPALASAAALTPVAAVASVTPLASGAPLASAAASATLAPLTPVAPLASVPSGAQEGSQEPEPAAAMPSFVGAGYPSPRECMEVFLGRAHELAYEDDRSRLDELLRALDLSPWLDGDWRAEAVRRSKLLLRALDHTAVVDLDALLGPEDGLDLELARLDDWEASPAARPEVTVEVLFKRTDGDAWVVHANTLERAPRYWESVRDLPVASELVANLPLLERARLAVRQRLPAVLLREDFVLENWQWAGLLGLLFLGVVLDRLVRFVVTRLVRRLERSERLELESGALANFERPFGIFVIAWTFAALLPLLGIAPSVRGMLDLAASFVMTVAGIWAAVRMVDLFADLLAARARKSANTFDDMLVPLARKTLKLLVAVVGLVWVTSKLTDQVWSILAGLSIGSIAVGFAARDSIENLFGTFTVLMDKPFQLGDWIVFEGVEGTVEKVGFRSTRLRTFYNSVVTVPNRHFISGQIDNMGKRRFRRIKTTIALTYDTPPTKVDAFCEGVRELIRQHPYTRKDFYLVTFTDLGQSALEILLYAFVETPDWATEMREKHRLLNDVLRLAERLGVSFAFPTQTVHLARPEDLLHDGTPESWQAAERLGEEAARAIAAEGLAPFGGARPAPAVIEPPEPRVG